MVAVNQLSVEFNGTPLFDEVTFLVNRKERIGLAGKNGAGKSTLLKVLASQQQADQGEVAMQSGCTVGYLPQEMHHQPGKTVFDEAATAFIEVKQLEQQIHHISLELEKHTDHSSAAFMELLHQLGDANERLQHIGGYSIEAVIEQVLLGLGFERSDFSRLTDEFSGGWRMRIELAKILLQKPDLLLLDEPTNHLDIESIQWLEEFLKDYDGAIVLVSHDKVFLDKITTRTIEISLGKIYDYKANYSRYVALRKERKAQQLAEKKNQEKFIQHTETLIDKFRAKASKASFAQSLIKKLDKMERIEVEEEDHSSIRFHFPPAPRSGKVVIDAKELKKQYGDKTVFSQVTFTVERHERIAFVGRNGEGKTTLSKIVAGDENHEGQLEIGYNVSIGYFAQNQAELLDGNKTVLETIDEVVPAGAQKNARTLLGSFLFSGDAVEKQVRVLSGGEKSRLAMCKLLLQPYNLLVLDEPTNHLDIRSKEVLKNALLKYDGTLLIVSHDRDFLQGLTNKIFEFRNGQVRQYIGDVNEYLNSRKISRLAELEIKKNAKSVKPASADIDEKSKQDIKEQKQKEKNLRELKSKISKSEGEIERFEKLVKDIEDRLRDPQQYQALMNDPKVFADYEALKKQLENEMANWGALCSSYTKANS